MISYQPTEHDELLLKTYADNSKINGTDAVPDPHLSGLQAVAKLIAAQSIAEAQNTSSITGESPSTTDKDELRLIAVRDAYWNATDSESYEFNSMADALSEAFNKEASIAMIRKLFYMLPYNVLGEGIKWGFSDSVVRDSIYDFVRKNKSKIAE